MAAPRPGAVRGALAALCLLLPLASPSGQPSWQGGRRLAAEAQQQPAAPAAPLETFWLLLVGDAAVGKTALLARFMDGSYAGDRYVPSLGAYNRVRNVTWEGGPTVNLQVWDTAGQAPFRKVVSSIYRATHCVAIVWDPQNLRSFQSVADLWLPEARAYANPHAKIVLVAAKADMPEADVSLEAAAAWAAQEGLELHALSAKGGAGVAPFFVEAARQAHARVHAPAAAEAAT